MSRDSSDSEGLADWALVSQEDTIESDRASSGGSSEDFEKVTHDSLNVQIEHPESQVTSSLDQPPNTVDLVEDGWCAPEGDLTVDDLVKVSSSLDNSVSSTGDSICAVSEGDPGEDILVSEIISSESLASLSLVPDAAAQSTQECPTSSDVVASGIAEMLHSSSLQSEVTSDDPNLIEQGNGVSKDEDNEDMTCSSSSEVSAAGVSGQKMEELQWMKFPIETSSDDQCHTIRLGDGRVIVAPLDADLETLAASLHLSTKSESSSEAGSDSDFVRLETISTCSSSNENSDVEEDLQRAELPPLETGADNSVEDVMSESVSSVSSKFRFLPQINVDVNAVLHTEPSPQQPEADIHNDNGGDDETDNINRDYDDVNIDHDDVNIDHGDDHDDVNIDRDDVNIDRDDDDHDDINIDNDDVNIDRDDINIDHDDVNIDNNDDVDIDHHDDVDIDHYDDVDTESVSEHSEDERTESEQSENAAQRQEEEEERALEDIADIPLVHGDRQYVHTCNSHLNWTLDVIVIMVLLLTLGIAIGHSIGSLREQHMQYEVNQAQQSRMSLLQDDLQQCHQNTDQLLQRSEQLIHDESERRREVVNQLSYTNSELRGQMDALEEELHTSVAALHQCRQTEVELREVGTDLRNMVTKLKFDKSELDSRVAALPPQAMEDFRFQDREMIDQLSQQVAALDQENADLKIEVAKLRAMLPDETEEIDEGYESDNSEGTSSSSCSLPEGHGKVRDLKSRINQLEQENADMRAEIGRLRYKSHPGNTHSLDWDMTHDTLDQLDAEGDFQRDFDKLRSELHAARQQAENWERLYNSAKTQKPQSKCNDTHDFFSCVQLLSQKINSSINTTSLKQFLNVTKILTSMEDVTEAFVHEVQNIWRDISGQEGSRDNKSQPRTQKKWSDSVNNILNKTQNSMSQMSRQIQNTWNQVKNLSHDLWKKHEPGLSKVAKTFTEKVKTFSSHVTEKIHKKASKWFRKQKKHHPDGKWRKGKKDHHNEERKGKGKKDHSEERWVKEKKDHNEKRDKHQKLGKPHKQWGDNSFREKHKGFDKHKRKQEQKSKNYYNDKEKERLKKAIRKKFEKLRDMMDDMRWELNVKMTPSDVKKVCDFFKDFHEEWNLFHWLKSSEAQWSHCQYAWWRNRLNDENPRVGLKCLDKIYPWQKDWEPTGDFQTSKGRLVKLGERLRKQVLERNPRAGKRYSYEDSLKQGNGEKNETEWYEKRAKEREQGRSKWKADREKKFSDWYSSMMNSRTRQREEDHKSDWMFQRAQDREDGRNDDLKEVNGNIDPQAAWMFERAEDREFHNSKPDSWYFRRSEDRQMSHTGLNDDNYDDEEEGDDSDDDEDYNYRFYDFEEDGVRYDYQYDNDGKRIGKRKAPSCIDW